MRFTNERNLHLSLLLLQLVAVNIFTHNFFLYPLQIYGQYKRQMEKTDAWYQISDEG